MENEVICVPGQQICLADEHHIGGKGTYTRDNYIYSTLSGYVKPLKQSDNTYTIEVHKDDEQSIVPTPGAIVTCKVLSVTARFAKTHIVGIDDIPLHSFFRGMIRQENVRLTEIDKVEMYRCFRPGDIVLAKVISLGDSYSYLLSTAENELGVVIAYSEAGVSMIPTSWTEMQCPKTYVIEPRKVAKIVPENFKEPT